MRHIDRGAMFGAEMCVSLDTSECRRMPALMAVFYLLLPMFHGLMLILPSTHSDSSPAHADHSFTLADSLSAQTNHPSMHLTGKVLLTDKCPFPLQTMCFLSQEETSLMSIKAFGCYPEWRTSRMDQ